MNRIVTALLLATGTAAIAQDAPTKPQVVNAPAAVRVTGLETPVRAIDAPKIPGRRALRIEVPGKGDRPWRVNALNTVRQPVAAGSTLILAFWARLEKGEGGATTATLPSNAIREIKPPSAAVLSRELTIDGEWRQYEVRGVAERDYAADTLVASLHLATGKQTIDLGPVYVLATPPKAQ